MWPWTYYSNTVSCARMINFAIVILLQTDVWNKCMCQIAVWKIKLRTKKWNLKLIKSLYTELHHLSSSFFKRCTLISMDKPTDLGLFLWGRWLKSKTLPMWITIVEWRKNRMYPRKIKNRKSNAVQMKNSHHLTNKIQVSIKLACFFHKNNPEGKSHAFDASSL